MSPPGLRRARPRCRRATMGDDDRDAEPTAPAIPTPESGAGARAERAGAGRAPARPPAVGSLSDAETRRPPPRGIARARLAYAGRGRTGRHRRDRPARRGAGLLGRACSSSRRSPAGRSRWRCSSAAAMPSRRATRLGLAIGLSVVAVAARRSSGCGGTPGRKAASSVRFDYLGETFGVARATPVRCWRSGSRGGRPDDRTRRARPPPRRPRPTSVGVQAAWTSGGAVAGCGHASRGCGSATSAGRRGSPRRRIGDSVGFLVAFVSPDRAACAQVHLIGVDPESPAARASGRALYEHAIDTLRGSRRQRRSKPSRPPDDRIAIAFHRALGFTIDDGAGTHAALRHAGVRRLRRRGRGPRPLHARDLTDRGRPARARSPPGSADRASAARGAAARTAPAGRPARPARASARGAPRPRRRRRRTSARAGAR